MLVVIVGQGYVGLPLAMRSVEVGHTVVGLDADPGRVARLVAASSYVEDVSDADLRAALGTGRYRATSDPDGCAGFDVAIITVPTPLREGLPDLSYIEQGAVACGRHLRPGATVVLESTTYPGTTEELVAPILERESGLKAGRDFHLGYSPERIDPGNPLWTLVNTPKVVSGIDGPSLEAVQSFFDTIVDKTFPVSGCKEAELTKLLENTFRHVNVALVNELAMFAADLGIDVWESIAAAGSKPFGFMAFTPGPGVGGHCLPIDPSYLSWRVKRQLGQSFRFVELANDVNDHMPDYVSQRVMVALNRRRQAVNGSRALLLGLAYKRNTSDDRESPAVVVADRLVAMGAEVRAADPHVERGHADRAVVRVQCTPEEVEAADIVVLLTDHDAFDFEMVAAKAGHVLDTRHRLAPGPNVEYL
ncbi:MAG: nucleotide sugar dehydrogenase [Actinomycetota bacterium]